MSLCFHLSPRETVCLPLGIPLGSSGCDEKAKHKDGDGDGRAQASPVPAPSSSTSAPAKACPAALAEQEARKAEYGTIFGRLQIKAASIQHFKETSKNLTFSG